MEQKRCAMTQSEMEWLTGCEPGPLLRLALEDPSRCTARKCRLFACACCRFRGTPGDIVEASERHGSSFDPDRTAEHDHGQSDVAWARFWTEVMSDQLPLAQRADMLRDIAIDPSWRPARWDTLTWFQG